MNFVGLFSQMAYLSEEEVKLVVKRTFEGLETYLERVIDLEIKKILSVKKRGSPDQLSFI